MCNHDHARVREDLAEFGDHSFLLGSIHSFAPKHGGRDPPALTCAGRSARLSGPYGSFAISPPGLAQGSIVQFPSRVGIMAPNRGATGRLGRIIQAAAHMQRPEWVLHMGFWRKCEGVKCSRKPAKRAGAARSRLFQPAPSLAQAQGKINRARCLQGDRRRDQADSDRAARASARARRAPPRTRRKTRPCACLPACRQAAAR